MFFLSYVVREPADAGLVVIDRGGIRCFFGCFEVLKAVERGVVIRELPNFAIIHTN
jgi:hypothetical protein